MQPTIINRCNHTVSRKQMSEEALKVLYRLHRTGNLAYLCGGGVRDLLLGRATGDFDVVTDAEPKRLKELFRNSRLIGRRFRIAHIIFKGGKVIEVSTFRKKGEEEDEGENTDSLLIKRDNTFGSPAEDAFRRDFTVNALYYNIADFTIIDHVGGMADLQNRIIRSIGDPDIRFQEDPVRILRGIRLAATLDFQVEQCTRKAMGRHRHHILECPASRVREDIMKIFRRSNTHRICQMLSETEVLEVLFPKLDEFLRSSQESEPALANTFWQHLALLDSHRTQGAEFDDSLLLAILTATPAMASLAALSPGDDVGRWLHQYLQENFKALAIPRAVRNQIHLLHLALRYMLAQKRRKRRRSLRRSPLFPDALRLLEIHCQATQKHWGNLHRWRRPETHSRARRGRAKQYVPRSERNL